MEQCSGFRVEKTSAAVLLHIPGLEDTAANAGRLASAKHLLDSYLGKPVILKTAAPLQKLVAMPSPASEPAIAAASD